MITVLDRRGRHIENGRIEIGFDNKQQYRQIMSSIKKSNMYVQESGAEIAMIKHLIEKIKFEVKIHLIKSHEKQVGTYEQNLMKHLIKECDRKAKTIREESRNKMNCTNIKFYGSYTMKRNGELQSKAVKEVMRVLDAREEQFSTNSRSL